MSRQRPGPLDLRHPVFRPLWRRVLLTAALIGWTVVELVYGNAFWALLIGGIGVYAAFVFFVAFDPSDS